MVYIFVAQGWVYTLYTLLASGIWTTSSLWGNLQPTYQWHSAHYHIQHIQASNAMVCLYRCYEVRINASEVCINRQIFCTTQLRQITGTGALSSLSVSDINMSCSLSWMLNVRANACYGFCRMGMQSILAFQKWCFDMQSMAHCIRS